MTGSRNILVTMMTATPMLALMASSRITPMSMTISVEKPTASQTSAMVPGMNSRRKVALAAAVTGRP